jgi:hypothetical protein
MSSVLSGDQPPQQASAPTTPPGPPGAAPPAAGGSERNSTLIVIAGVGVLLLAMGVGVLIGRAGSSKQGTPPAAQVITVASPTSTTSTSGGEASFTGDWPSGTTGYTVQLQTLAQSGTSTGAVEAAKSAATAKGAKSIGALKSEEFSSLTAGSYVIYSGVYHKRPEAEKALAGLKKSFPGAKVIKVSGGGSGSGNGGAGSSSGAAGSGGSSGIPPSSLSHPAPPTVLNKLKNTKGKSYEETSKSLPNVVETG